MRVGIVGQKDNRRATSVVSSLCESLRMEDVSVVVDETTASQLSSSDRSESGPGSDYRSASVDEMADCDLVVSVGGDGTFLYAVRGAKTTPIMGVNLGEVGFLNAVAPDNAVEAVRTEVQAYLDDGEIETREMPRIRAHGDGWQLQPALNEVVVQGAQRGHGNGASFDVRVDGERYVAGHADGVLVASQTGSTAYNLSESGPLVHPDVDGLVVTQMCGTDAMPSLVVDDDATVSVHVDDADEAMVVSDGRTRRTISPPTRVTMSRAGEPVHVAGPSLEFFAALGKLD